MQQRVTYRDFRRYYYCNLYDPVRHGLHCSSRFSKMCFHRFFPRYEHAICLSRAGARKTDENVIFDGLFVFFVSSNRFRCYSFNYSISRPLLWGKRTYYAHSGMLKKKTENFSKKFYIYDYWNVVCSGITYTFSNCIVQIRKINQSHRRHVCKKKKNNNKTLKITGFGDIFFL